MAADRSLMAWERTSLSLSGFGFAIYKILDAFQVPGGPVHRLHMPRDVGLFLVALGTVAMVLGSVEYWYRLKNLRRIRGFRQIQPSLALAMIMSVAGVFMFGAMLTRIL